MTSQDDESRAPYDEPADTAPDVHDDATVGDADGRAVCLAWADLTVEDYAALFRQAGVDPEVVRELRAIVRGVHPYAEG